MSAARPISLASASNAPSSETDWSRLWKQATRFSRRSSTHATDVLSLRASQVTTTNSGASDIFCPKPPPTSGAITRRSDSGIPIRSAMIVRIACGICVAQVSVTRSLAASHAACAARGSIGKAFCRCERMSTLTRRCAPASFASKPGVFTRPSTTTFPAASSWTSGAPGAKRRVGADDRRNVFDLDLHAIGNVLGLLLR